MELDLILLGLVALFAFVGAITGAAKQLAQLAAIAVAYLGAYPIGSLAGPRLAKALEGPPAVGTAVGTLLALLVLFVLARLALAHGLGRLFAGKKPDDRAVDRTLGFLLGGLKAAAMAYVIVCALVFIESHVSMAGRRLGISPKGSVAFALARRFNVFELVRPPEAISRAASAVSQ
ncbi:MAG: CvpA family protein [Myxococcales bacterium]|nr:CvpA family protein [Myxococcales bacterium]